ncbi:bystin-like [Stegodyphus dumicola]|uniref:bystin-like n=1 Tax=Stegodyphus dumicola TaxID=202533 RepID=UPI0015A80C71|nr:bystin-like [Stegodyphus dumicola]
MGKIKRIKAKNPNRHNPLDQEIIHNRYAKSSVRIKVRKRQEEAEELVDNKLTRKILKQVKKQQEDLEEEVGLKG